MILTVNHETVFRYEDAVLHSTQYLRLTPRCGEGQKVLEWQLDLPMPAQTVEDPFGNILHVLTLDMPHREIRIRASGIVETEAGERMSFGGADPLLFLRPTPLTAMDESLTRFADRFGREPMSLERLDNLAGAVLAHLPHEPGSSDSSRPAAEAFAAEHGSCQDHAHIFIACCRHLGVAARYVSGYVYTPDHGGRHMAAHAWAEAWFEDRWWSFDVVNRCRAGESYLKLATGMDYLDACPVRGVRRAGSSAILTAQVNITRMSAQPPIIANAGEAAAQLQQ